MCEPSPCTTRGNSRGPPSQAWPDHTEVETGPTRKRGWGLGWRLRIVRVEGSSPGIEGNNIHIPTNPSRHFVTSIPHTNHAYFNYHMRHTYHGINFISLPPHHTYDSPITVYHHISRRATFISHHTISHLCHQYHKISDI